MKLHVIAATLLTFLAAPLHAAISPIHMDIEQDSKTKQPKATPGKTAQGAKTQSRSLTIKLSNNSAETFDRLVVRYWFLGYDLKDRKKITVITQGERKSALAPRGKDTVESEVAPSTYTEAHSEVKKGKGGKGGKGSVTKVPASGKKITGYAVQVLNGTKVETEEYSAPGYKEIVQASAPSLLPAADAPKKAPAKKKKK